MRFTGVGGGAQSLYALITSSTIRIGSKPSMAMLVLALLAITLASREEHAREELHHAVRQVSKLAAGDQI